MKKKFNDNPVAEYEALEKQLMALFRSGVYMTGQDVRNIAKECGYEMPLKEREIALRNLLKKAKADDKLLCVFDGIIAIIDARMGLYKEYANEYEGAKTIINSWIQKVAATKMLLHSEKQKALATKADDAQRD